MRNHSVWYSLYNCNHREATTDIIFMHILKKLPLISHNITAWCAALLMGAMVLASSSAQAAGLIRDAEIEETLALYFAPILKAADYPGETPKLFIINDNNINAFVAGGANIFIHTGLLMKAEHPDMIQGVLAHELGHVMGGHLIRSKDKVEDLVIGQGVTTLLAIMAAAGGSGEASKAIFTAGTTLTQSGFFEFSRTQEQSADQAGLSYMDGAHISSEGLLDVLKLLRKQERFRPEGGVPYLRSHPLTTDRIAHIRSHASRQAIVRGDKDTLQQRHDKMRAKLAGFLLPVPEVMQRYEGDTSLAGDIARSLAYFRNESLEKAISILDARLEQFPDDAYLHELKGQMLYERGKIPAAQAAYRNAHELKPNATLIMQDYAKTLIADGDKIALEEAVELLTRVTQEDPLEIGAWKLLAIAQEKLGNIGQARLAQAEAESALRNYPRALHYIEQAKEALPQDTAARLRAEDLQRFIKEAMQQKKEQRS